MLCSAITGRAVAKSEMTGAGWAWAASGATIAKLARQTKRTRIGLAFAGRDVQTSAVAGLYRKARYEPSLRELRTMNDRSPSDLAELVRRTFDAQGFMRLVGAKVEFVERGKVTLGVDRRDELLQQHGFFHGGVVALLIDNATGAAAATVQRGEGQGVLTAEYKINFVSPGVGDRLSCTAEVVKPGRRMTVVEAKVHRIPAGRPSSSRWRSRRSRM